MKKSGREKRAEISLALFMFLLFCLFISVLTALGQEMSTKCLTLPPSIFCMYFPFFPFFPFFPLRFLCHFLSISFSLPSILCCSILLFSLHISPCFLHMIVLLFSFFDYCLPFFSVPFSFFFYLYPLLPSSPFFDFCVLCIFLLFLLLL